jgi:hypothetical protein
MILFCVEIWPRRETVEAEDKPENQRKWQLILYITAKRLFANYFGPKRQYRIPSSPPLISLSN